MSKHTPGNWSVANRFAETLVPKCAGIFSEQADTQIAWIPLLGPETEANAALIAAAPDMLEELKVSQRDFHILLCQRPGVASCRCGRLLQLIAKAEGRSA